MHLAYLPRNERDEFGTDRGVAGGWLGRERKFEEG